MSEMCMIEAKELFEPVPGYMLVKAQKRNKNIGVGQYGLSDGRNLVVVFPETPYPKPPYEEYDPHAILDDDNEPPYDRSQDAKYFEWVDKVKDTSDHNKILFQHDPLGWYDIVNASILVGYKPDSDGIWYPWIFDRVGRMLQGESFENERMNKGIHLYPMWDGKMWDGKIKFVKDGFFTGAININRNSDFNLAWDIYGIPWKLELKIIEDNKNDDIQGKSENEG